jgi:hypothetical protein
MGIRESITGTIKSELGSRSERKDSFNVVVGIRKRDDFRIEDGSQSLEKIRNKASKQRGEGKADGHKEGRYQRAAQSNETTGELKIWTEHELNVQPSSSEIYYVVQETDFKIRHQTMTT